MLLGITVEYERCGYLLGSWFSSIASVKEGNKATS
jgi:hypothetical protein